MNRETFVLFILPIVLLVLGILSGFYFGVYNTQIALTACQLEKSLIPSSPVITHSQYDPKTHQLVLDVENPGGMPIYLLTKSLILKPANVKLQPVALMINIPLNLELPPYSKVTLRLNLGQQGSWFNVGDVLVTTLTYQIPVSNDIYSVEHVFKHSGKVENWLVQNALPENAEVKKNYENKIKANNSWNTEKKQTKEEDMKEKK